MRSRLVLSVFSLLSFGFSGSAHAQATERTWIYSGSELKQAIEGRLAPEVSDPELRRQISVTKAGAYIAGVADSTGGTEWCGAGVAPHELNDRVYSHLEEIPAEQLNGQAATFVREALVASFPCEPKKN